MARATSNNSNNSNRSFNNRSKGEQAPAPAESGVIFKVEHVRDWGRNGGISFSLRIEGGPLLVEIYGCRIINGREGEFVAFPQRKGKDGRYYKHAYVQLTDDQTDEIVSAVYDALED